jgi:1-acyl-sn-glycerol-3-phosphate acyltransferase
MAQNYLIFQSHKFAYYLWRIFATASFFICFGLGAMFLAYIILPLLGKNNARSVINKAFRFFIFTAEALRLIKINFINFDLLSADTSCLIISNHPTLIDYVCIAARIKNCNTIVKQALWQNIFLKGMIQKADYIPNKNWNEIFLPIQKAIASGDNLLIFPEGTRTTPHEPIQLRRGTAQIALRLNIPIRIIYIRCQPVILTKKKSWCDIPRVKPIMTLEAGELIDPKLFLRNNTPISLAARKLTQYLQMKLNNRINNEYR